MSRVIQKIVRMHPTQRAFHHSTALYRAFCGGRGAGKTTIGAIDLIRRARRGRIYAVIGPTFQNMRDSSLRTFLRVARDLGVLNPSAMKLSPPPELTLSTGATIIFRSGDDPERLRGPSLAGAWLDEASLMTQQVYDIMIASLRDDGRQGWLTATFTPNGPLSWVHDVFNTGRPDTALFRARTVENPFNPPGFADTLRAQYGDSPFARQELDAEFVQLKGATFPAHWLADTIFVHHWPGAVRYSVLYLDPSQGKEAKDGDAQAYCRAGFWPGPRNENLIYLDCTQLYVHPPEMVARGVELCREHHPDLFGYEVNGTMGLLAAEIDRQLGERQTLQRTWQVTHTAAEPKFHRIRNTLMPYLAQGRVRILDTPGGRRLRAELQSVPHANHDDCADAAAGAVALLEPLVNG